MSTPRDHAAIGRRVLAKTASRKFPIPESVDPTALGKEIDWIGINYEIATVTRPSARKKTSAALRRVASLALDLATAVKRDAVANSLIVTRLMNDLEDDRFGIGYGNAFDQFLTSLPLLAEAAAMAHREYVEESGKHRKGSAFVQVVNVVIREIFERTFSKTAKSGNPGAGYQNYIPNSPFIRFAEAALIEAGVVGYSRHSIVDAMKQGGNF